jgi:hypothetical protein
VRLSLLFEVSLPAGSGFKVAFDETNGFSYAALVSAA